MYLKDEDKAIGRENFELAISAEIAKDKEGKPVKDAAGKNFLFNRREALVGTIAAGAVSGGGLGAMYFSYGQTVGNPVRIGVIGTGDEGGVLIGALNPEYVQCVAIADIRPYNIHRALHGDWSSPNAIANRPGLMKKYGWADDKAVEKNLKIYRNNYEDLLNDKDVEAVIIALPLHLHAEAAIKAMKAGKHVLVEKLMGHSVAECKEMARVAKETGKLLATGHQRHYSILYENAKHTIRNGFLGDIHHIRAQWHRKADTWSPDMPVEGKGFEKITKEIDKWTKELATARKGGDADAITRLTNLVKQKEMQLEDKVVDALKYGYMKKEITCPVTAEKYTYSPMEELIRWRLWERTGGGLMAELGSHQLDASTIFCSEAANKGPDYKAHPLTVTAVGGRHLYKFEREAEDHVYCIYEFPGPKYESQKNNKIAVTYSSINGNPFGDYGEIVMGDKGTLVLLNEKDPYLFSNDGPATKVGVAAASGLDTTASGGAAAPSSGLGKAALDAGPISRGYTEEIEHWAWCIRNPPKDTSTMYDMANDPDVKPHLPRCHPKVAMADAIIALTTNMCMRDPSKPRMEFQESWFDVNSDETPEGVKPDTKKKEYQLGSNQATV